MGALLIIYLLCESEASATMSVCAKAKRQQQCFRLRKQRYNHYNTTRQS
ncbi:hypothetical protein [Lysinibacillus sp. NPDC056232]